MTEEGAELLAAIVAARSAFLVTGGTGTGKTTLLAAMLSLADPGERLVLVEDSSELRPAHPHVIGLEARPPNIEGAGEITLRTLVRQALRMRPDRLVVGEVRGAEVVEMLAALNTGHAGGCGTVHANSAADVPGPARGPGPGGRAPAGGRAQPARRRPRRRGPRGPRARRRTPRGPGRRARAAGPTGWWSSRSPCPSTPAGRVERGPAARELSRRISP